MWYAQMGIKYDFNASINHHDHIHDWRNHHRDEIDKSGTKNLDSKWKKSLSYWKYQTCSHKFWFKPGPLIYSTVEQVEPLITSTSTVITNFSNPIVNADLVLSFWSRLFMLIFWSRLVLTLTSEVKSHN